MEARWQERVHPGDVIYHLGDFALCSKKWASLLLERLPGHKVLIHGNHDGSRTRMLDIGFDEVHDRLVHRGVLMIHDPQDLVALPVPDSINLAFCGHVHEKWKLQSRTIHREFPESGQVIRVLNVGVDQWDFAPVQWETALEALDQGGT